MKWMLRERNIVPPTPDDSLLCRPEFIKFCDNHGIDRGPGGSTWNDLHEAMYAAINKLEAKQ